MTLNAMPAAFERFRELSDNPTIDTIRCQVRTSATVPFSGYMLSRIDRSDAPCVDTINPQVRTSATIPFASYMLSRDDQPSLGRVDLQVRTSASVPFADYMRKDARPAKPDAEPVHMQVRTSASVAFNPYMLGAHAEELMKKRVMISPVLVAWEYRISDDERFSSWLATREILLSESRLSGDAELKGIRYGGTYRVASGERDKSSVYKTVWGYSSETSMEAMHRLCSDSSVSATIVQLELIDFVKGLKSFISTAGEQHFSQEVLISPSAGRA